MPISEVEMLMNTNAAVILAQRRMQPHLVWVAGPMRPVRYTLQATRPLVGLGEDMMAGERNSNF